MDEVSKPTIDKIPKATVNEIPKITVNEIPAAIIIRFVRFVKTAPSLWRSVAEAVANIVRWFILLVIVFVALVLINELKTCSGGYARFVVIIFSNSQTTCGTPSSWPISRWTSRPM